MNNRYHCLTEFIDEIMVICPQCQDRAVVISDKSNRRNTRLSCMNCGLTKKWNGNPSTYYISKKEYKNFGILLGHPFDCYFNLPLWYTVDVKGHTLFAYNLNHLDFLEQFISSTVRNRSKTTYGWSNKSLESRLPKWIQSAKNRNLLLRKINTLKSK
ncbi:MAG: hypothetical protein AAFO07_02710 [Bacteroidota bacterium]